MKTSTLPLRNPISYYFIGVLSILLTSCGSYQNSSYYDSDGIYGSTQKRQEETQSLKNQYKDYFGSLQNNNQSVEIFTDVDNYGTTSKTTLYKTTIIILAGKQPTKRKYQCL
jgi:hypothetical protein